MKLIFKNNDEVNCRRSVRKRKKKLFPDENIVDMENAQRKETLLPPEKESNILRDQVKGENSDTGHKITPQSNIEKYEFTALKLELETKSTTQGGINQTNSTSDDENQGDEDDDFSEGDIDNDFSPSKEAKLVDEVDKETLAEASKHIFSCTYCNFSATDLFDLRLHYNEKHPNDILTCQPCNQYFLSLKVINFSFLFLNR